jgi:hypothetical protein
MKFALGLGHVITWSLVGLASPYLLQPSKAIIEETALSRITSKSAKPTESTEIIDVNDVKSESSSAAQMMVLSSSILSLVGVAFIASSYFRAGSHVKELVYNSTKRSMIVRSHRPFATSRTIATSKLRLEHHPHLSKANSDTLMLISDDGSSFVLSGDGMFLNKLYLISLLK